MLCVVGFIVDFSAQRIDVVCSVPARHVSFIPLYSYPRAALGRFLNGMGSESSITVLVPRVGQKSYGNEKRFFCPSPLLRFDNISDSSKWHVTVSPHLSGIQGAEACGGVNPSRVVDGQSDVLVFKNFHIGDLKRSQGEDPVQEQRIRKDFELYFRIQTDTFDETSPFGDWIATLASPTLTLISKPSKKKPVKQPSQGASTLDVLAEELSNRVRASNGDIILNGGLVALFNRQKSQTVSTRFMGFSGNGFTPKNATWDALRIQVVNEDGQELVDARRPVCFGDKIVLACTKTGWRSDWMMLRKVDKTSCELNDNPRDVYFVSAMCLMAVL
jgi:recombining binding protein (suppressor of hairless)